MTDICKTIREKNSVDLILIQGGAYMCGWNEDADKTHELFDWKIVYTVKDPERKNEGTRYTGFPCLTISNVDRVESNIKKLNLSYVILEHSGKQNNDEGVTYIERLITRTSIPTLKGMIFKNIVKTKKTEKNRKHETEIYYLRAILNGVLLPSGEVIDKSSPWMHPKIQEDIEEYLEWYAKTFKDKS